MSRLWAGSRRSSGAGWIGSKLLRDSTVKLLVLGDSLSDGGWERDPRRLGSAWPARLERLAADGGRPIEVVNRAQGGARSQEVLTDYREATDLSADTVAVLVGANDLWRRHVPWMDLAPIDPDDYHRNLVRVFRIARERGASEVWALTPCLLQADPDHPWNTELLEYRDACRRAARDVDALLVPTGEEFETAVRARPEVKWTYDGVHPRPVGQERLASSAWLQHRI